MSQTDECTSGFRGHLRCAHKQLRLAANATENTYQRAALLELADDLERVDSFERVPVGDGSFTRASEIALEGDHGE